MRNTVAILLYSFIHLRGSIGARNSIISQLIVTDKVVFGAILSTYVIYTKIIIHLGVGESGGYYPPLFTSTSVNNW